MTGVEPGLVTARALAGVPTAERVWIIAVGKAAEGMARAALTHLAEQGRAALGGLVVTARPSAAIGPLVAVQGDHPLPGPGSLDAAEQLAQACHQVGPNDEVWVLVSGGTSSLIGAPIPAIPLDDFLAFQELLFRAPWPIDRLNAARKRVARFGAGRLAGVLGARAIRLLVLSDVPTDDPADIGSGPCTPDPTTARSLLLALAEAALRPPDSIARYLDRVVNGLEAETAKPGDPIFSRCHTVVVGSNRLALAAGAARARTLGYEPVIGPERIRGDAAEAGKAIARQLIEGRSTRPTAYLWGGETTVPVGGSHGRGGRCQELGIAGAELLRGTPFVLLAAGTDGRDGPTDAAGALIDGTTWNRMIASGIDPARALREHDSYPALDRVGALLRTGPSGTNVMDVIVGLAGAG